MVQRTKKQCSVDGCENPAHARGWCKKHYLRWHKHGDPLKLVYFSDPEESFAARTEWQGDCLIWIAGKNNMGYGKISIGGGATMYAHRYAWERANGPIPEGTEIDHICHTPLCCNPDHLRLSNRSENTSYIRSAQKNSKSGFRNVYPAGNKWYVQIRSKGVIYSFGTYECPEEASEVANRERKRLHGDFFKAG